MQELMPKGVAATVPPLYATEEEADPVARVKLFSCINGWTWYVTEYDPATGEAFGLVEGFGVIERDEHFEPAPVREVRR